ncbi:MAG: hypothetical protein JWQ96_1279 [Segetibacter sp.]|nr:hypothetical protein [Segetibacter sp.]
MPVKRAVDVHKRRRLINTKCRKSILVAQKTNVMRRNDANQGTVVCSLKTELL